MNRGAEWQRTNLWKFHDAFDCRISGAFFCWNQQFFSGSSVLKETMGLSWSHSSFDLSEKVFSFRISKNSSEKHPQYQDHIHLSIFRPSCLLGVSQATSWWFTWKFQPSKLSSSNMVWINSPECLNHQASNRMDEVYPAPSRILWNLPSFRNPRSRWLSARKPRNSPQFHHRQLYLQYQGFLLLRSIKFTTYLSSRLFSSIEHPHMLHLEFFFWGIGWVNAQFPVKLVLFYT